MANALKDPWLAPTPDEGSSEELIIMDPRMITAHRIGELPCPPNPPPPDGWRYWKPKEAVPAILGTLAVKMRDDAQRYPMGAFTQVMHAGELVAARVEWHDMRGRDGAKGCFRGVNLMRRVVEGA
ncbi:MAG: hypothetical protein EOO73_05540 [Myxococcales bacterium]|nr:MAG: hypothetical protein EOO73_05540 [Myxococcales bacterium]